MTKLPFHAHGAVHNPAIRERKDAGTGQVIRFPSIVGAAFLLVFVMIVPVDAGGETFEIAWWGWNEYGQAAPPEWDNFTALSAGTVHSLAVTEEGGIVGWGNNTAGQLDIPSGNNYTAVGAGWFHSIALTSDGSIVAWGNNHDNQTNVPEGNNYIAIAAGSYHNLALTREGTIVAWGSNNSGQTCVPPGNNYVAIAAGSAHSLALTDGGEIVAWGNNLLNQTNVPAGHTYTAIAAGIGHSLALTDGGEIVAWGWNDNNQTDVPAGNNYVAISGGIMHSLALTADGAVVGWGDNSYNQTDVPEGNCYSGVVAGYSHSFALKPTIRVIADFSSDSPSGAPRVVRFTDLSQGYPDRWWWDFGDGSFSSVQNPYHAYLTPGTYTVNLTARNTRMVIANTTVKTEYITVNEAPTIATITPGSGKRGKIVTIQNLSGTGFMPGLTVSLDKGTKHIPMKNVVMVSSSQVNGKFRIPAAARTGRWDVTATNADGQSATRIGGFRVRA